MVVLAVGGLLPGFVCHRRGLHAFCGQTLFLVYLFAGRRVRFGWDITFYARHGSEYDTSYRPGWTRFGSDVLCRVVYVTLRIYAARKLPPHTPRALHAHAAPWRTRRLATLRAPGARTAKRYARLPVPPR